MWDDAGTVKELLQCSIGTISLLSVLTCISSKHTLVCLLSPFRLCLIKGGAGFDGLSEKESVCCVFVAGAQSMPNPLA